MFWLIGCGTSRLGMVERYRTWISFCLLTRASRKRADIPVYSFAKHQRMSETTSIYSPHVLILEGIFALYDPRVLELLDMGVRETHGGIRFTTAWRFLTCCSRYIARRTQIHVYPDEVSTPDSRERNGH